MSLATRIVEMKKVLMLIVVMINISYANSPIGYWKTIDDRTHQARGIVQITESHGELQGKIVKFLFHLNKDVVLVCKKCSGDQHNKPVLGMRVITGMKLDHNKWDGGNILDPENGKQYRGSLRVSRNNQVLAVHAYEGIPLFGRTQYWQRVNPIISNYKWDE